MFQKLSLCGILERRKDEYRRCDVELIGFESTCGKRFLSYIENEIADVITALNGKLKVFLSEMVFV